MRIDLLFRRLCDPDKQTFPVRALTAALLLPSALYGAGVSVRNRAYSWGLWRRRRLPVPVVSVGAITVGGAGKTPMTRYLAERLLDMGYRPAILSRGYGRTTGRPRVVTGGCPWQEVGDEPALLSSVLPGVPVVVGADRLATGQIAIETCGADVIVLDDGFQRRDIHRDVDIVMMDAAHPAGNGRLLPAGPLREPLSALRRAQAIVLTRTDQTPSTGAARRLVQAVNPDVPIIETVYRPAQLRRLADGAVMPLNLLDGRTVVALSGIADPASFERTVASLGASVAGAIRFPDHHPYTLNDIASACHLAGERRADWIVTTAKDAVRMPGQTPEPRLLSVDIALTVTAGESDLKNLMMTFGLSSTR